jgi:hypothetical protein
MSIEQVGVWLTVGRALARKLGVELDSLRIEDFCVSACGLRVFYSYAYFAPDEKLSATIAMPRHVAQELVANA